MSVKSYAPSRVKIVMGAIALSGLAEDTFVTVAEIGEGITSVAGVDGEVARAMSRDTRLRITVTLLQTSASNALLSALHQADKVTDGDGAVPVAVTDLRGKSLHASDSAWIVKSPEAGYGAKVGTREWVIETGPSINVIGGNS
ncbi:phage structural protein [Achromobacter xylosoxidans]|uniref:phage structural protein n=1 Tax=Alcaligenes xylosoxydans xylosoxydans TaxID=85698 RepID=UPI001F131ABA|nr:phage protein [Achromobacter xylosoxidans]